jgi:sialate O-acetylesterase
MSKNHFHFVCFNKSSSCDLKKYITLILLIVLASSISAQIKLPKLLSDNMVLQRHKPIRIWGWASANEKVTVAFNHQTKSTSADTSGKWQVMLKPENAGGPFQVLVKGKNEIIIIKNVLVGEVWVCSGQSNMEMPIADWGKINNYEQEIAEAEYPLIRHFKVPKSLSTSLKDDVSGGEWQTCSPSTAGDFSATAYFFARELYKRLKVPIGLINTSWGGTIIETWISEEGFSKKEDLKYIANNMKLNQIDSVLKQGRDVVLKYADDIVNRIESNPNPKDWKNIDYNDAKWPVMALPGLWENQGLKALDGILWFRYTFHVDETDFNKPASIELAKIDDWDETYINGKLIGATKQWDLPRKYDIPSGVLKPGKNVISVKVEDNYSSGGIYGDPENMYLKVGENIRSLAGEWKFMIERVASLASSLGPNDYPTLLYNAMINPLLPYTIQGAIWYQGESNASRAHQYESAFQTMIKDWRHQWKLGDFPFLFAQLSTYGSANNNSNNGSTWAELREAQSKALALPNTGMAVTTDIGDPADIHPKNKQDVGKRLAAIALHDTYKKKGEHTGPLYQSMKVAGDSVVISFTHTGTGLKVNGKDGLLKGFEIAGADKKFHAAKARILGNKIIVRQENVKPVAVRYNWVDDASTGNLFNGEQFPAAPFRRDDWSGLTDKNSYNFE